MSKTTISVLILIINGVGCLSAGSVLLYWMFKTKRDDLCRNLVQFEWAFLCTLVVAAFYDLRNIYTVEGSTPPSGLAHSLLWVAGLFFARYLRGSFR
jgi:hypothetical protein